MKFGKQIQAQEIPGWSTYYIDYKFLKKIISSLVANRPASEAAALASGVRPTDIFPSPTPLRTSVPSPRSPSNILDDGLRRPPIFSGTGQDKARGPDFQAHKAAFFFKLERELEKVNSFYLQKEAELKLRMETLLSKRRAAAMRGLPDETGNVTQNHVEWSAVEEGFRLLERDLGKLQQYIEVNATGFRKILKKFDKRSTSTTKELYLSRQVDVQPVFNRQLISELSDTVAICLLDLTDLSSGLKFEGPAANDIFAQQVLAERTAPVGPLRDLENNLRKAVATNDVSAIADCVRYSDVLAQQNGGKTNVARILWNIIIEASSELADLIFSSLSCSFDFQFVDDINGRTCLHEAAIAGSLSLVDLCIQKGVRVEKTDLYGRTALHYASMHGNPTVCQRLLASGLPPNTLDRDNYTPFVYATMRGSVDCVRVLLDQGHVPVEPTPSGDFIPLSLASQSGHVDVVSLLLEHGAHCLANSNGEYPMHLAAREGHPEVCKYLLHLEGWDVPDKYYEWTPLFHAARYGRDACVQILLDAGARVDARDELGHLAVHYAAWYGHHECLSLLDAAGGGPPIDPLTIHHESPLSDFGTPRETMEIDLIPSLSLPPPIMPHRVYGHNYLDKSNLVEVTIGHSSGGRVAGPSVRLHHRLINPALEDEYILASAPLKLVMTTSPSVNSAPYSISLPQREQKGVFSFQIPTVDTLSLEFSIYPNFGTKTIGRAVALPSLFEGIENNQAFTLPILDTRLHVIGEVDFEVNIINSFEGVTLEVAGDVETYWKSMAMPVVSTPQPSLSRSSHRSSLIGSAHTSPSVKSVNDTGGQAALTISSLHGSYVFAVVQVTRDLHPVVYSDWLLPGTDFNLCVSDVTLEQFDALSHRFGRHMNPEDSATIKDWSSSLTRCMISLADLLKFLPLNINISLELAYPSRATRKRLSIGHRLDLNEFVDAVLRNIYHASTSLDAPYYRRRIVFASFSADVCSALNWKQPNYPVFFVSRCGKNRTNFPVPALSGDEAKNSKLSVIGAAVEFAKSSNLLGVFVDAELLTQVPSLIHGIRNAGLLVGIHGTQDHFAALTMATLRLEGTPVDAFFGDGNVVFMDQELI